MKLHRSDRDNYVVSITTVPPVAGTYQASFDREETWVDGTPVGDDWAWMVAGPDFDAEAEDLDPGDTVATITEDLQPLLRIKEDPVLLHESGPAIELWG